MKATRFVAVFLLVTMLLTMLLTLPIFSAETEKQGMSFTADSLYRSAKPLEESPVTFEAWIKLDENYDQTQRAGIIIGNVGVSNTSEKVDVNVEINTYGKPMFYANGGKIQITFWEKTNLTPGEWTHLAIVYKAGESVLCYVNGEFVEEKSISYDKPLGIGQTMCLGGDHRSGNGQYFKGQIASVAIYSDVRTADEIESDMMNGYGEDGLIASYDVSTLSNGEIVDGSGNGYDMIRKVVWPDGIEPPSDFAYSFAVVGDTQTVALTYPDKMDDIYNWILNNAEANKTKFVMGLGDIVDSFTIESEWENAMAAMKLLDGKIPYSVVRGNHDSVELFNKYVKYDDYKDVISGSYEGDMRNTYQKFSVGNVKYMVFALDYGPSNDVLAWAKDVIDSHPDYNVIITTHAYLFRDGTTLDVDDVVPPLKVHESYTPERSGKNNGDHIWDKLVSQCENIVLVLSGHDPWDDIVMTQEKGLHGNTVTQMLIDPQAVDKTVDGGVGAVAMLYFSEDGKDVTVRYYSTLQEKYFMNGSQFSMTLNVVESDNKIQIDESGNTTVTYATSASYTVTIPESVIISSKTSTGTASVSVADVVIAANTQIKITVAPKTGGEWVLTSGSETLYYTITKGGTPVEVNGVIHTHAAGVSDSDTELTFAIVDGQSYKAGSYAQIITFTVDVESAA